MDNPATPAPSAPAAPTPAAPAPTPAAPAPTQATELAPVSAIDQASEAARTRLAQEGSAVTPQPEQRPAQHRNALGEFEKVREITAEDAPNELLEGTPARRRDTSEGAESEAELDAQREAAPETPGEAEIEAAAAAEGQAVAESGEADDDALTVEIPGRNAGETVQYRFDTQEEVDDFRRLVNGYMRGEQAREIEQRFRQAQAEVESVHEMALVDPAGFLFDAVKRGYGSQEQPQVLADIALALVTDPEVWREIGPRIMNFDDETERRTAMLDAREKRQQMQERGQQVLAETRVVNENFRDVQNVVTSLMPETWDEGQQSDFYRDALIAVQQYAEEMNVLTVAPHRIPIIVADVMARHGLNPVEAAQRVANRRANNTPSRPAAMPDRTAAAPAKPRTPVRTAEKIRKASNARRAAAALPGSGRGAPTSAPTPPENQSIEERIEWHRKQTAAGRRLMTT